MLFNMVEPIENGPHKIIMYEMLYITSDLNVTSAVFLSVC